MRILRFLLAGPLGAAGLLLPACSSAPSSDESARTETPAPTAPATPYGARVDSLDGLPGHHFGEPLARFPGIQRNENGQPGPPVYRWPDSNPHQLPWFAKHHTEVPGVFYTFLDGRFARFQAVAYSPAGQAALAGEARYLFGPGRELGDGRVEWAGQRAVAVLSRSFLNGQAIQELDVYSLPLEAAQTRQEQARLQAENAASH